MQYSGDEIGIVIDRTTGERIDGVVWCDTKTGEYDQQQTVSYYGVKAPVTDANGVPKVKRRKGSILVIRKVPANVDCEKDH